jgi:copper chaperone
MKTTFKITKMHCVSCSMLIDTVLEELPGVKSAQTSFAEKTTTVEYDATKVTPKQIIEIIKKENYEMTFINNA